MVCWVATNLASLPFSSTNTRERCQDVSSSTSLLPFSIKFPEPTTVPSLLNPKVSWDRLKRVWRRPKTPLRTPSGGISTLGLQELKEQVRMSPEKVQPAPSPRTEHPHGFCTSLSGVPGLPWSLCHRRQGKAGCVTFGGMV